MRLVLAALFHAMPAAPAFAQVENAAATRASVRAGLSRPIVTRTFTSALIQSVDVDPAEDVQQC
jgi:hypothetical protein